MNLVSPVPLEDLVSIVVGLERFVPAETLQRKWFETVKLYQKQRSIDWSLITSVTGCVSSDLSTIIWIRAVSSPPVNTGLKTDLHLLDFHTCPQLSLISQSESRAAGQEGEVKSISMDSLYCLFLGFYCVLLWFSDVFIWRWLMRAVSGRIIFVW